MVEILKDDTHTRHLMKFAIQNIAVSLPQLTLIHLCIAQRDTQPRRDALFIEDEITRQGRVTIDLCQVNVGIQVVTGHDHMVQWQPAPLVVLIHTGMNTKAQMGKARRQKGHARGKVKKAQFRYNFLDKAHVIHVATGFLGNEHVGL